MKAMLGDRLWQPAPYQHHSDTSRRAAQAIEPKIGDLHKLVIGVLQSTGGATDEEIDDLLRRGTNTLRPRRRELELMGKVKDSGKRRITMSRRKAVVWILAGEMKP